VTASPRTLQVVLTVEDYEQALAFYRDGLGLEVLESWEVDRGRGVILDAGRATLELLSVEETERVNRIEAGEPTPGPVRFALEVGDSVQAAEALVAAGGERVGGPPSSRRGTTGTSASVPRTGCSSRSSPSWTSLPSRVS
jgi:catechol 2,3-dioxygenase-like lactoylglutathione lyase family enzyme